MSVIVEKVTPIVQVYTGRKGDKGEPGEGVPIGGTTGQFLIKTDDTDYNTEWGNKVPGVILDQASPITSEIGALRWGDEGPEIQMSSQVTQQIGQEVLIRARNNSGMQIGNGWPVVLVGASSATPYVTLVNNTDVNAGYTIAVATETIADNQVGYFTTIGVVRDINTNHLDENLPVWLGATDGALTSIKPLAPAKQIVVGFCLRKSITQGAIFVRVSAMQGAENVAYIPVILGITADNVRDALEQVNSSAINPTFPTNNNVASAALVGKGRYRASGNNSYFDVCMQTGATTYAWVNIKTITW